MDSQILDLMQPRAMVDTRAEGDSPSELFSPGQGLLGFRGLPSAVAKMEKHCFRSEKVCMYIRDVEPSLPSKSPEKR